jgi:hypothetical protein
MLPAIRDALGRVVGRRVGRLSAAAPATKTRPAPVETVVSNAVGQFTHLARVCKSEKGRATWLAEQARADAGLPGPVRPRKRTGAR